MQLHEKNWRSTHTQAPRIQNRGRFRRSNIRELMKDMLYEVRYLKSSEDIILALTGQFK